MDLTVGIGDFKISDKENDVLRTYALSSCIAVTAYSPVKKVAGMLHVALPEPSSGGKDINPAYFATTGIPLLIDKMCREYGCLKNELQVRLYGGADSVNKDDIFKIGRRNILAVNKTLENLKLPVCISETGGMISRSLVMDVSCGKVRVQHMPLGI